MEGEMKEEGNKPPFFGGIMVIALCIIGLIAWAIVDNKAKEQQAIQQDSSYLYTSELEPRETATIVIQCDEERYQESFNDFVAKGLKEENADVVGMTGGPRWFVLPVHAELPSWLKPAKRATIEFLKRHSPGKVILIAHQHCIINDVVAAWKDEKLTKEQEIEQLKQAAELIKSWFPASEIKMYYAEEINNKLGFIKVEQDKESEKTE